MTESRRLRFEARRPRLFPLSVMEQDHACGHRDGENKLNVLPVFDVLELLETPLQ